MAEKNKHSAYPAETVNASADNQTSFFEGLVEQLLVLSRWLLTPIFVGLIAILVVMIYKFYDSVFHLFHDMMLIEKKKVMLSVLELIDFALVASLVVMVAISGYENFISSGDNKKRKGKPSIFSDLDPGKIKIKLAMSIIAISSIRMLQIYMEFDPNTMAEMNDGIFNKPFTWYIFLHLTFVFSGMAVTMIEKISHSSKKDKAQH